MKIFIFCFLIFGLTLLGFCRNNSTSEINETVLLEKKINQKYSLTAVFYGANMKYGDNNEFSAKLIQYVSIMDNNTGKQVKYLPTDSASEQASDFYFTEIWSPDEEYLILPVGKFEGFGIFEAKDAIKNIESKNYLDTIKVKSENSGFFWHNFEKWEDNSTFSFRAGLDGDMFAFKYNLAKPELYCYRKKCEEFDIGVNSKGKIKPFKKGDIEPTEIH